jgi:integrase
MQNISGSTRRLDHAHDDEGVVTSSKNSASDSRHKHKTSDAPKCKGGPLAPRSVRRIYGTVRVLFKSAVIDEHIAASPALLEANVLPMDIDKDPEWRSTAIFEREELIALISDDRIPHDRRVQYALEGIAGVRHGEAAALRIRSYNPHREPLGCLTVARSGTKKRTKTQLTREIPVHPTLAVISMTGSLEGGLRRTAACRHRMI